MRRTAAWLLPATALLAGCAREPLAYPPPAQRLFPPGRDPDELGLLLYMNDPRAPSHIVSGVDAGPAQGVGWRWVDERAELRFTLPRTHDVKAVADFALVPAVFEKTGPVHVSLFINGRLLEKRRYDRPARYKIEKPVPEDWLKTGAPAILAAEADKYHTAADGVKLSFILYRAGFALRGEVVD